MPAPVSLTVSGDVLARIEPERLGAGALVELDRCSVAMLILPPFGIASRALIH